MQIFELTAELTHILKSNAPVRTKPLGKLKYSPYPGHLKQNAIVMDAAHGVVVLRGDIAPYVTITEQTSRKKGWMKRSELEFLNRLLTVYGGVLE